MCCEFTFSDLQKSVERLKSMSGNRIPCPNCLTPESNQYLMCKSALKVGSIIFCQHGSIGLEKAYEIIQRRMENERTALV